MATLTKPLHQDVTNGIIRRWQTGEALAPEHGGLGDDFAATGGAGQFVRQFSTGVFTVGTVDLDHLGAGTLSTTTVLTVPTGQTGDATKRQLYGTAGGMSVNVPTGGAFTLRLAGAAMVSFSSVTGGAGYYLKQGSAGGAVTSGPIADADLGVSGTAGTDTFLRGDRTWSKALTDSLTLTGNLIFTQTSGVRQSTSDGADDQITAIGAGGAFSRDRGPYVIMYGNENSFDAGVLRLNPGSAGSLRIFDPANTERLKIDNSNVFRIYDASAGEICNFTSTGLNILTSYPITFGATGSVGSGRNIVGSSGGLDIGTATSTQLRYFIAGSEVWRMFSQVFLATGATPQIGINTSNGSDSGGFVYGATSGSGFNRGATLRVYGNEHGSKAGLLEYQPGEAGWSRFNDVSGNEIIRLTYGFGSTTTANIMSVGMSLSVGSTSSDGSDSNATFLGATVPASASRGANVAVYGNENGTFAGGILLAPGVGGWVAIRNTSATETWRVTDNGILGNTTTNIIATTTSDTADNSYVTLAGGGATGVGVTTNARGAFIRVFGNENANTGQVFIIPGSAGDIRLYTPNGTNSVIINNSGFNWNTATSNSFLINTTDGSDNSFMQACAGSAVGNARGGYWAVYGNEYTTSARAGWLYLGSGNVTDSCIAFAPLGTQRWAMTAAGLLAKTTGQIIGADTSAASDTFVQYICGGPTPATSRGAILAVYGIDEATHGGRIRLIPGVAAGISITNTSGTELFRFNTSGKMLGSGGFNPLLGNNTTNGSDTAGFRINGGAAMATPGSAQTRGAGVEFGGNELSGRTGWLSLCAGGVSGGSVRAYDKDAVLVGLFDENGLTLNTADGLLWGGATGSVTAGTNGIWASSTGFRFNVTTGLAHIFLANNAELIRFNATGQIWPAAISRNDITMGTLANSSTTNVLTLSGLWGRIEFFDNSGGWAIARFTSTAVTIESSSADWVASGSPTSAQIGLVVTTGVLQVKVGSSATRKIGWHMRTCAG